MAFPSHASRRALAAAVVIAVAFAGCGDSDERSEPPAAATSGLDARIAAADKQAKAAPDDPDPLAELAKAHFQAAGLKTNSTGGYTDDGKQQLREATKAWDRYLALDPDPLDTGVAQLIAAAYGPGSLDRPKKAVEVQILLTENLSPPRASQYARLAQMAYYAGETETAEKAGKRAIELSPGRARRAMRRLLSSARQLAPTKP